MQHQRGSVAPWSPPTVASAQEGTPTDRDSIVSSATAAAAVAAAAVLFNSAGNSSDFGQTDSRKAYVDPRRSFSLVPPSSMDFDSLACLTRPPHEQTFTSGMMHSTLGMMLHDGGTEAEAHRRRLLLQSRHQPQTNQQHLERMNQFSFPVTAKTNASDLTFVSGRGGGSAGGRFEPLPLTCTGGPLPKSSQPHYSPITPVPGGSFGGGGGAVGSAGPDGSTGGHFTFPPSEALLSSTDSRKQQSQSSLFIGSAAAPNSTMPAFCSQQRSSPSGNHLSTGFPLFQPQSQRRLSSPPPPPSLSQNYRNTDSVLHSSSHLSPLPSATQPASSVLQQRFHQRSISLAPGMLEQFQSVKPTTSDSCDIGIEAAPQTGLHCYDTKTANVFDVRTDTSSDTAVEYTEKWPVSLSFSTAPLNAQESSTISRRWSSPKTTGFHHHRSSLQHELPLRCDTPLPELDSDRQRPPDTALTASAHFGQVKTEHSVHVTLSQPMCSQQPQQQADVRPTCSTPEFLQTTQPAHPMLSDSEVRLGQKPIIGKLVDQEQQISPISRHYTIDSPRSVCLDHFASAVPSEDPFLPPVRTFPYQRTFSQAPRSTPAIPSRHLDASKSCFFFPEDGEDELISIEQRGSALSHTQPTAMEFCPSELNFIQSGMVESMPTQEDFGCDSIIKLEAVPLGKYQTLGSCETQNQQQPMDDALPVTSSNATSFGSEGVTSDAPLPVFRNPQAPPPTSKKYKRKPEPIAIPSQQTWMNSSRLRSPRLFNPTESGAVSSAPPPYTPPPMLSPNRRGPGLFSSVSRGSLRQPQNQPHQPPSHVGGLVRRVSCASALKRMVDSRGNGGPVPVPRNDRAMAPKSAPFAYKAANFFSDFDLPDLDECRSPMSLKLGSTLHEHSDVSAYFDPTSATGGNEATSEVSGGAGVETTFFHYADERASVATAGQGRLFDFVDTFGDPSSNNNTDDALNSSTSLSAGGDDQHVSGVLDAFLPTSPISTSAPATKATFDLPCEEEEEEDEDEQGEDEEDEEEDEDEEEEDYDRWGATPRTEEMRSVTAASALSPHSHTIDMDQMDEEVDEGFPSSSEPTINIGPAYQAELPDYTNEPDPTRRGDSRCWEILLWDPKNFNDGDAKSQEALSRLMTIACSPAVRTCGLNMEYTFHLLCKFKGNMEQSLRALLQESFIVLDNVYAETTPWCTEEIGRFQYALRRHEKDFHRVSKELQAYGMDKSVKACVEFYYVWKRMNTRREVNRFRGRHSRRTVTRQDVVMELRQPDLPGAPPPVADRQQFFELTDPPVLSASGYDLDVTSSVADGLVINGNPVGTTYNLRKKPPKCHTNTGDDFYNSSLVDFMAYDPADSRSFEDASAHFTADVEENQAFDRRFSLPTTAASVPVSREPNPGQSGDGEQGFTCRLCGRCFSKVKSRNAHMKSHSDRSRVAV
ncbi:factor 1 [Sparganum proliferum]